MSDHREPAAVAARYFVAWAERDWDALGGILAAAVTFRGPLGTADSRAECLAGLRGMAKILTGITVRHCWADGPDVLTWFDLHTSVAPPAPTANWSHVEDGLITRIQVTFDARPLAPPSS
jgi:hypothetical protein